MSNELKKTSKSEGENLPVHSIAMMRITFSGGFPDSDDDSDDEEDEENVVSGSYFLFYCIL